MKSILDTIEQLKKNPYKFSEEFLGVSPWGKQREILEAVFKYPRVAVKSCNAAGKSWTAANVALSFLYTHPDSIVVTTAPTGNQVFNVMWREIRGLFSTAKIPLGGEMMKQRLELDPNWYAFGFSTDKDDNARGFHAKGSAILIICDEASGIPPSILDALEGNLTSGDAHILYIGNPTNSNGRFYDAFSSQFFHKISIAVWDTPNFIANGIKNVSDLKKFKTLEDMGTLTITHPYLVTPMWAYMRLNEWGEDSPMFQSLIEANFPTEGENVLIPLTEIDYAIHNVFGEKEEKENLDIICVGIDVARYGTDNTVLTGMKGYKQECIDWYNGKDTMDTVGRAIKMFTDLGGQIIRDVFVVDDTGVGGGVTDRLRELGYNVLAINFGSSSEESEKYMNKKAEIFWNLRTLMKERKLCLLDKGKLIRHLSSIEYKFNSSGKLQIVSKDEMKKKGMESTDFADSLALALHGVVLYGQKGWVDNTEVYSEENDTIVGNIYSQKF